MLWPNLFDLERVSKDVPPKKGSPLIAPQTSFYRSAFECKNNGLPKSEWIYKGIISLPIYPGMRDEDVERVIDAVSDIIAKNNR